MWYWLLKNIIIGPILRLLGRPEAEGLENIPEEGPVIIASNHLSVIDSFFVPLFLKRQITFIAKNEYFTQPGVIGAFKRWFFTSLGEIPIDRTNMDAAATALKTGVEVLEEGGILGIYPEGTRSPDGRLYRGKSGVIRIAQETGAPIVPVAMIGTREMNPPGTRVLRPKKIRLKFGAPMYAPVSEVGAPYSRKERVAVDRLMRKLADLSGQEYVEDVDSRRIKLVGKEIGIAGKIDYTREEADQIIAEIRERRAEQEEGADTEVDTVTSPPIPTVADEPADGEVAGEGDNGGDDPHESMALSLATLEENLRVKVMQAAPVRTVTTFYHKTVEQKLHETHSSQQDDSADSSAAFAEGDDSGDVPAEPADEMD